MPKSCQSCAMPMSRDPQGGGSEADDTRSDRYCSLCYENGDFIHDISDVRDFQAHCVAGMKQNGWPGPVAWLFTRGIPKLERWTKA